MMRVIALASLPVLLLLSGCGRSSEVAAAAAPTPIAVARGVVEVQGGLVRVLAPRDGVVLAAPAQEGDEVAQGQMLVRIDDRQARLMDAVSASDVAERRAQADVAAARAAAAEVEEGRLSRLAAADATPRQDYDQAAAAAAVLRREQRQAQVAIGAADARRALSAFEVAVRDVHAPVAGRIVRRTVATGAYATATAPLFVIEPQGPRVVRAELDESFADRVRPGMAAVVSPEFQAGGGERAQVLRVADVLGGPALAEDATGRPDARVVTITLALPTAAKFRVGQRVLVRFTP